MPGAPDGGATAAPPGVVSARGRAVAERAELLLAASSWLFCSVGMTVFNKLAIARFPHECSLVVVQMLFTVFAILAFCRKSIHIGSTWDVLRWCRTVPFFAGVLLTSMLALKDASITLVVVFRCLAPLVSLAIEQFYPEPLRVDRTSLLTLLGVVAGAGLYCKGNEFAVSDWRAVGWILLNNGFVICDKLLQRLMLGRDQMPVDISKSGVTLLNNSLGLIPILLVAVYTGEVSKVTAVAFVNLSAGSWFIVLCTCIAGVGIAYNGVWTQSLISATSFLVLATGSKFFVVLIDIFFLKTKVLSPVQLVGVCVAILSSVAYGQARSALEVPSEAKPLIKGSAKESV